MIELEYEGSVFKTKNSGDLIITKYVNSRMVHVRFFNTGYETNTEMVQIKRGNVKDRLAVTVRGVGILGDAPTLCGGKKLKEYMLWGAMMARCYDPEYQNKNPTYRDCYVSNNFKNYSYFRNWCLQQTGFNRVDWELDKDIVTRGNKYYSEEHCVFVPQEINKLLCRQNKKQDKYPVGVYYDSRENNFQSRINNGEKQVRIGRFSTVEDAFHAYKQAKEARIKLLADKYRGQIDERAYESLMSYQVNSYINTGVGNESNRNG